MGRWVACAAVALIAAALPSAALAQQPTVTLTASAPQVRSGSPVTLSGQVTDVSGGAQVVLYQAPYPYSSRSQLATATSDPSGTFSFTVSPALDTRYVVQLSGTSAEASVQVSVTDRIVVHVKALP